MSKVVYRGVEYDTQKRLEYQQQMMQQPQQYNETYRGVKFVKEGHKWILTSFVILKEKQRRKNFLKMHNWIWQSNHKLLDVWGDWLPPFFYVELLLERNYFMDKEKVKQIVYNLELLIRSLKEELERENNYQYEQIAPYIDDYEPEYYEEDDS